MITLYAFNEKFGLPEASPYVTKTEVQLKMAGLPYRKEAARPQASPKGQLPYIEDDGALVADSAFIRMHVEARHGVDLDAGLDPLQRAQAWALERMIEGQFIPATVYARWMLDENFEKGPAHLFDDAPEAMRAAICADVRGRVADALRAIGVARHSQEEIVELGERSLATLSLWLGDKPYLFGDRPAGVDAVAFAALAGILTPFFDSPLRRRAERFDNLVAYTDRLMARYYPDFAWTPASRRLQPAAA